MFKLIDAVNWRTRRGCSYCESRNGHVSFGAEHVELLVCVLGIDAGATAAGRKFDAKQASQRRPGCEASWGAKWHAS